MVGDGEDGVAGGFFEPGELFLGEDAGVFLYAGYGGGEITGVIEILEEFFVAYCVE